jgi:hypothetical protein
MRPDVGESRVRTVGPGLHIVENEPLERILFERGLIGLPHRRACFAASRLFLAHVADDLVDAAELVILSKGLAYQLAAAAESVEINLPTNLVATTRVDVVADDAKVDVSYARFDAGKPCLVVGDTVASGATVIAALDAYRQVHRLERLFLLSYAGSAVGARRIAEFCARLGVECTILYGLAAFGLGANGFDLSFAHPDTVTPTSTASGRGGSTATGRCRASAGTSGRSSWHRTSTASCPGWKPVFTACWTARSSPSPASRGTSPSWPASQRRSATRSTRGESAAKAASTT